MAGWLSGRLMGPAAQEVKNDSAADRHNILPDVLAT